MGLFRKKCAYCEEKIERGSEVFRDVKDPVFVGTKKKAFCCDSHAEAYTRECCGKKCTSGCCG